MSDSRIVATREHGVCKRRVEISVTMQPLVQLFTAAAVCNDIEFGPIAGRQKDNFVDARKRGHAGECTCNVVSREDDLLANFDRCRVMVQPEYLQRHNVFWRR